MLEKYSNFHDYICDEMSFSGRDCSLNMGLVTPDHSKRINVLFKKVKSYYLIPFLEGNIISSIIQAASFDEFAKKYGEKVDQLFNEAGGISLHEDAVVDSVEVLYESGWQLYLVNSSYGVRGYIIAKEVEIHY